MILLKSSFKYFTRHYIQSLLAILGIVLGVSMLVAIDLCIESSKKAFATSLSQSFGKASHYIYADANGFNDELYRKLKVDLGIEKASPYLEADLLLRSPDSEWQKIKLLGLDPFSYRDFSFNDEEVFSSKDNSFFKDFLLCNNCIALSKNTAKDLSVKVGESLEVQIATGYKSLKLIKILDSRNFDNLLILDIASAQSLLNQENLISRIDLIVGDLESVALIDKVKAVLPKGLDIIETIKTKESTQKMMKSFNLNLYSLSFLSLIVAIFLIFNTISFSVTQRTVIFGIISTLGIRKNEIFKLVLLETLLIAILASFLGIVAGYGLGQFLIKYISQTINDLYFVINVNQVYLAPITVLKGFSAGILAALIGAIVPALQASNIQAAQVVKRSTQEINTRNILKFLPWISVLFIAIAYLVIRVSADNIILNFFALGMIVIAYALLAPIFIKVILFIIDFTLLRFSSLSIKMAVKSVERNLSRTAIAITALMIALSISLSLDITVNSFRQTVSDWLDSTLKADVYISAPSLRANRTTGTLDTELINKIKTNPLIRNLARSIVSYRNNQTNTNLGEINLASIDLDQAVAGSFRFKEHSSDWLEEMKDSNSLIISEPLAYKKNLKVGSVIDLRTKDGYRQFKILAIFFDYGSDQGIAMIHRPRYQRLWGDYALSSLGIMLKDSSHKNSDIKAIKDSLAKLNLTYNFNYRSNFEIKKESIKIFNRTFRITDALKIVTILIAFIAIVSVLLSLNLERYKEFAILEAIGFSRKELGTLLSIQCLLMGSIAALLSMPLGLLQAYLLVNVINLRSFGWTLNFHIEPSIFVEIMVLALLAAFLASIYPSFRHIKTALALRND